MHLATQPEFQTYLSFTVMAAAVRLLFLFLFNVMKLSFCSLTGADFPSTPAEEETAAAIYIHFDKIHLKKAPPPHFPLWSCRSFLLPFH